MMAEILVFGSVSCQNLRTIYCQSYVNKIKQALNNTAISSMSGLLRVGGIGEETLIKCFDFIKDFKKITANKFCKDYLAMDT